MSLPAHLRSLVSAAASRVQRDRAAAAARAEHIARLAAQSDLAAQTDRYDAALAIQQTSSLLPEAGYVLSWDDCPLYPWGPSGTGPLASWTAEQFAPGGLFQARLVSETNPGRQIWVWPTFAAALAAACALDPASAKYLAGRASVFKAA